MEAKQITPIECLAVLEKAMPDFLAVMEKLSDSSYTLQPAQSIFVVYYLEAIIILKHLQRPGTVEHMTVSVSSVLFWAVSIHFS